MLTIALQALAGTILAWGTGKLGSVLDRSVGSVDRSLVRSAVGPLLPLVATVGAGLAGIGLTGDDAQAIAQAPIAGILGVSLREVTRKWVLPRFAPKP